MICSDRAAAKHRCNARAIGQCNGDALQRIVILREERQRAIGPEIPPMRNRRYGVSRPVKIQQRLAIDEEPIRLITIAMYPEQMLAVRRKTQVGAGAFRICRNKFPVKEYAMPICQDSEMSYMIAIVAEDVFQGLSILNVDDVPAKNGLWLRHSIDNH